MINTRIKNFIKNHANSNPNQEVCGFIVEHNNQILCIKCENVTENKTEDFQISIEDYLEAKDKYNILYIYHSHINDNPDFSEKDRIYSNEICINYILYHLKSNKFKIHESNDFTRKYIGRYYEYKKYDCYTLVKDFFKNELNFNLNYKRYAQEQIMLKDLNVNQEVEDFYKQNNLIKINSNLLEKNDLIIINSILGGHLAIYLGENKILHQPLNSFSRVDNYCNFYKRNTVAGYRRS